ncbi:hypothetical protein DRE_03402 [Drechslerella stenobrocha 248]|uniref:RNI-like protein n=1 Tax=Drechslerella stenobrocha 248 TaxID=1043628 RepID=W7I530_9PEZI|nr:hypothetical protein DRE_03402 [Drechslerella stenobrocha 248]
MASAVELDLTGMDAARVFPVGPSCSARKRPTSPTDETGDKDAASTWPQKIRAELEPFFDHLSKDLSAAEFDAHFDASHQIKNLDPDPSKPFEPGHETGYKTEFLEFPRGVVYSDHRMDLCKMVVGPTSIGPLMNSLESNTFIQHFLLGNNIIGPTGAAAIVDFLAKRPAAMRTWYLAGNCIDPASFDDLVDAMVRSPVIENLWLKRNPLGPASDKSLFKLLSQLPRLRTLDLDQTDLDDACLARLFSKLCDHFSDFLPIAPPSPLHSLYLNGVGLLPGPTSLEDPSQKSAMSHIAVFLSQQTCQLTSLYIANNLLGDAGCTTLATGLQKNNSLERLSLQSVGASSTGLSAIFTALSSHPRIKMFDAGQSYATIDLGMQFNMLDDAAVPAALALISSESLKYLDLGYTSMTQTGLNKLFEAVANNQTLLFFNARSIIERARDPPRVNQMAHRLRAAVRRRMVDNVAAEFDGMTYETWFNNERRWLVNDREDVRAIDSVYRNRDAGMARRGQMVLKKWWTEENKDILQQASGRSCALVRPAGRQGQPEAEASA